MNLTILLVFSLLCEIGLAYVAEKSIKGINLINSLDDASTSIFEKYANRAGIIAIISLAMLGSKFIAMAYFNDPTPEMLKHFEFKAMFFMPLWFAGLYVHHPNASQAWQWTLYIGFAFLLEFGTFVIL